MNSAEILARLYCHEHALPWAHVPTLVAAFNQQFDDIQSANAAGVGYDGFKAFSWTNHHQITESFAIAAAFRECGSPIEELFLAAMADTRRDERHVLWEESLVVALTGSGRALFSQQANIGSFRVDFLFDERLVVELDGHSFHERTKEQAARDKARDRKLQQLGFQVFRFTGSEVWKDPHACVAQCLELVFRRESA